MSGMDRLLYRLIETEPTENTSQAVRVLVRRGYADEVRDAYETVWEEAQQ